MRKKKLVKRVAGIALTVGVVILAIVCVGKVNRIQNEKDIIGTWKDTNAEEVFTFQENGELAVSKDMPDSGLSCGNASYGFSYEQCCQRLEVFQQSETLPEAVSSSERLGA